ncbi:MAG: gfo/Idh/MocA family oxidoreductase, partial [Planctomycetaceae bacterium]|nr:gfo/Idh/MocA family oxidoreductase [Planctomycetaceae bacterium]
YARCAYYNARGGIGQGKKVPAPDWLNWSQWQGPAPHRDYQDNVVHYNWHWFWHWGTGELGNNGVHYLDVLRWGLGVDYPTSVSCQGGSLRHQDDQETPDTTVATYEFGKSMVMWEQRSWFRKTSIDADSPMTFFGTNGSLEITDDKGYRILDPAGKELSTGTGASGEADHLRNFLGAIRGAEKLNCEIEEAYRSTLLCLLANISYRVGRKVTLDPQTHQIQGDPEAMKFWQREYEPGYEIKVS